MTNKEKDHVSQKPLVIILLAGMGSRLNRPHPKCLTPLINGETILSRQIRILSSYSLEVCCVVGFKKDLIMEAVPDALFVYNSAYDSTNTSKSLLAALNHVQDRDVLWLNGDVVFTEEIIQKILAADGPVVAVNNSSVGEEEVKYTVDNRGFISSISKIVEKPMGEAVGINKITREYVPTFRQHLEAVHDQDYFEKAMEGMINEGYSIFRPIDVTEYGCIEVDFEDDLINANSMLSRT